MQLYISKMIAGNSSLTIKLIKTSYIGKNNKSNTLKSIIYSIPRDVLIQDGLTQSKEQGTCYKFRTVTFILKVNEIELVNQDTSLQEYRVDSLGEKEAGNNADKNPLAAGQLVPFLF